VFLAAYVVGLAVYRPAHALPITDSAQQIVEIRNTMEAPWSKVLLDRPTFQSPVSEGRYFRPLSHATMRVDALLVRPGGSDQHYLSLAYLALLSVAVFWLIRRWTGALSRLEALIAGLLAVGIAGSFEASEAGTELEPRSAVFISLFLVVVTGLLVELLLPRAMPLARAVAQRPGRLLAWLAVAVFACAVSKETGPIQVVAVLAVIALAMLALDRTNWRWTVKVAGVTAASLAAVFVYKAIAGTKGLLVSESRYTIVDTSWNIGPLDRLLSHVGPIGPNLGYAVSNAVRNMIATAVPAFTDYGAAVRGRIPFLIPSLLLVVLVALAFRIPRLRLLLSVLIAAAALVDATAYISLRPRSLLPSYSLWAVIVAVALVFLLRESRLPAWLALTTVTAAVLVQLALASTSSFQHEAIAYGDIYGGHSEFDLYERASGYPQYLEMLRARYGCALLPSFRSFMAGRSLLERTSSDVSGVDVRRPAVTPSLVPQIEARCPS
jgi:hypothetical protein